MSEALWLRIVAALLPALAMGFWWGWSARRHRILTDHAIEIAKLRRHRGFLMGMLDSLTGPVFRPSALHRVRTTYHAWKRENDPLHDRQRHEEPRHETHTP